MKYRNTLQNLLVVYALFFISGCNAQGNLTTEEKEWLIKKTKESLVFVPGGTFLMGDVGYTDENGQHRLFTNDPDCLPVHEVTLDSFSIMKYVQIPVMLTSDPGC